jgi:hypothetical protein
MRAGGIFGEVAPAGLGEAGTTYCGAATSVGIQDRRAGKANASANVVSRLGIPEKSVDPGAKAYLQNCYTQGYNNALAKETGWASDLQAKAWELILAQAAGGGGGGTSNSTYGPMPDTGAGKACRDSTVIASVQGQLGVNADGKWGPISQAALTKLGKTFKSLAPECTGLVPYYGGKSGVPSYTPASTTPSTALTAQPSASRWTSSPVFWAVALAVGVGGYLYLSGGKKGKK